MKFSPIYWVLSSVVLLAGVGMMGTAFAMEYKGSDAERKNITESFTNAENLKVEVSTCTLTLKSDKDAENYTVEFIDASGNPKIYMDGDTLHVEQKQKQRFRLVNFGEWQKKGKVIITVPERAFDEIELYLGFTDDSEISAITCNKLQLDCGVGDMTMSQVRIAGELDLDGGTGDLFLKDVTVDGKCDMDLGVGVLEADHFTVSKEADIDLGTGDCTIRNSGFKDIELDCGVGDLHMEALTLFGDADIRQGTGDVKINVADSSDGYSVEVEKGVGDVTINGKSNTSLTNRDAKYMINVECGVGDVDITFQEEN